MSLFDIETNGLNGVAIVATRTRLTTNALSASEIEAQVIALKDELDDVADRAKEAVKKIVAEPLFDEGS